MWKLKQDKQTTDDLKAEEIVKDWERGRPRKWKEG